MSNTYPSTGAGSLLHDFCGFDISVDFGEEWNVFELEWSELTAAHNYVLDTPPEVLGTIAQPIQPVLDPLLGDDWTDLLPASDFDFIDSTLFPTVSPNLPQTQTPQLYSPSQVDDGIQPNSWYNTPLIPSLQAPVQFNSDARSQQPSSAQNVNYSCKYCLKNFMKRHDLNRHTKLHTKPVACPVSGCDHGTAKRKDMNRHLVARHPDQGVTQPLLAAPVIRCTVPGCGFVQKGVRRTDNMKRHMRNKHGREVP